MTTLKMPGARSEPVCVWKAEAALGEGTCWSPRAQALWWVDILGRRLHRYRPADGAQRSWSFDEEISAVAERADATGLVMTLRRGLASFDPDGDAAVHYLHMPEQEPPSNRFNDGKCDRAGRFWGGTMDFACKLPTGALYRFGPGAECVRHEIGFAVTNGPTWSHDGRTMYFNDTTRGVVHAFDFDPTAGTLSNRREWRRLAAGDGFPDGMTTDAAGRIWLAHWGGGCVSCHDPQTGVELGRLTLPASQITNCCFGGPDLRTLYITSARVDLSSAQLEREPLAGGLFAIELDEPGVPPSLYRG
jgi:sugar lactone lactonase YvrE